MTRRHKGKQPPPSDPIWGEVRRKGRLTLRQLRMAQQLGLNPRRLLGNIASVRQETWKAAPGIWLESLWEKRYGDREPAEPVRKPKDHTPSN